MPIYVYQTTPGEAGGKPKYYEIRQRMMDGPLSTHPDTGEAIQRVILGQFGILTSGRNAGGGKRGRPSDCGPGCCCG